MKVGIYTRLSDWRDKEQMSTDRQEADCRELAANYNMTVVNVYEDKDRSGWKREVERERFEQLLRDMESAKIDGVIAWKLDRLSRNRRDYTRIMELVEDKGKQLVLVREPIDTTTSSGRAMLDMLSTHARMSSEETSERVKRAWQEKLENGKPHVGGRRPFGLTDDCMHIVEREAVEIKAAAERILAGDSPHSIANDWNRRGIKTTAGNSWNRTTLVRMLSSPRLTGKRVHHYDLRTGKGQIVNSVHIPPILDELDYRQLVAKIQPRVGNRGQGRRKYLLSGIVTCYNCRHKLDAHTSNRNGKKTISYVCPTSAGRGSCGKVALKAKPVEQYVEEYVMNELYTGAIDRIIAKANSNNEDTEQVAIARDQLEKLTTRRELLAYEYAEGEIEIADYKRALRIIDDKLPAYQAIVDEHDSKKRAFVDMPEAWILAGSEIEYDRWWDAAPMSLRWKIIGLLVADVKINPANKRGARAFDSARVDIIPREIDDLVYEELAVIFMRTKELMDTGRSWYMP